ncbi:unnamed protein product [Schistosoma curassoni]|nr:unnamed protein product [Schistosoma curassoni]
MIETNSETTISSKDIDLRINLTNPADNEKGSLHAYQKRYLSSNKDVDYRTYLPRVQMDSIRKEYCLTGNQSFIKTSCVTAYECNQPFVDRKWYSSQHSEQSLNLKNNGSARSSPNNSLPERKWQDKQSDSFNLPTINASNSFSVRSSENVIPKLTNNLSVSKSKRTRSLLKYWNSFDPEQIHYGVHRSHSHRQQQRIFSPMASLWKAMQNQSQIMVMTRGLKEPRASIIGNLIAFDRYWNLILKNVTEYSVHLPKSALKGNGKPGRSKKRREQRLRKFQRNNNALFQLKECSNLCHSPSNQTEVQLKDNQPLEIGQLFPDQYGDHDQDGIVEKEARDDEISRLRPFRLLGKSPLSDTNDHDDQSVKKCDQIDKSVLVNIHNHLDENNNNCFYHKSSNWTSSMVNLNERNMSELSDISLWYSLQTRRKHPLTEKQDNQQNEKIHIDDEDDDNEQQLFIRGANIILVRIISEN